jgi:hypothetical protein
MMQVALIYSSCMQGKGWRTEERSTQSTDEATLKKPACDERCKYYREQRDKCFADYEDPRPCLNKWHFPPSPE